MLQPGSGIKRKVPLLAVTALLLLTSYSGFAQNAPAPGNSDEIISFLNQTILWYRQLNAQRQLATQPSDVLFLNDNRQVADQVVRLAFEFARARAQAVATRPAGGMPSPGNPPASQFQRMADSANKAEQQVKQAQQQIAGLQRQLATATGARHRTLTAALDEAQSELELFQARRDTLRGLLQFASGGGGSASLNAQIEELARTVPSAISKETAEGGKPTSAATNTASVATAERRQAPSGILAIITDLFELRRKLNALENDLALTDSLAQTSRSLRSPLVATVRELTQQGDQLAAQPDSQDAAALAQQSKALDALTQQYKQLSVSLVPLGKQNILLEIYRRSTNNWRSAVESQYQTELKGLVVRLAGLVLMLGVVIAFSELWRRATFRYVTDPRRRYQFLLLRRVLLWFVVAIIVVVSFASELSGIGTFAGLLTAGIALSLQNVILAVVGYFLLIGKYGVHVGDRVQVAGVTGDVVDIGLLRLHVMEVAGGANPRPTGRVAAFSNSLVFQAGAGLFKQIPGTSFLWHEISLTLDAESNYREVEQRMLAAVNKVFEEYREKMEQQRQGMERALSSVKVTSFKPESHLRLLPKGLEVSIRYPVELGNAAEIDDRITRELLEALEREPKLQLLGAAGPTVRKEPSEIQG
jgi:small-conductance mechanosensitive channel